jgi:hypothetical protein
MGMSAHAQATFARVYDIQIMPQFSESCFTKRIREDIGEHII